MLSSQVEIPLLEPKQGGVIGGHERMHASPHSDTNRQGSPGDVGGHKSWWQYEQQLSTLQSSHSVTSITHDTTDIYPIKGASVLNMEVPNILNPRGRFNDVVALGKLDSGEDRLALLGGLAGVLSHMQRDKAPPDIKTFTILLDMVPSSRDMEADLFAAMTSHQIKPDLDFLNLVIRKRNLRKDFSGAKVGFHTIF